MKKYFVSLILVLILFVLCSCEREEKQILRVYNCVDYINEDVLDIFIEEHNGEIEIVYDTFETNESMYNTLRTGKTSYDLVCPSDYMIQKMIREDRLEQFDFENYDLDTYQTYASPYILNLFDNTKDDKGISWSNYAACYMWGTLGVAYNPEILAEAKELEDFDFDSWEYFLDPDFNGLISIKDSVRDTYCVGTLLAFKDELDQVENKAAEEYQTKVAEVINRCDDNAIAKVEVSLRNIKNNIYGLEVDSGKGDIVTGKIAANLAWSGDAVYSIDLAEDEDIELRYMVPNEGGNVWFDAWVMPKGANKELAQEFINFLSRPDIAAMNMEEIGYTSGIAGVDIAELIDDWYGEAGNLAAVEDAEEALANAKTAEEKEEAEEALAEAKAYLDEATYEECDLTYFFNGTLPENDEHIKDIDGEKRIIFKIDTSYLGRQFSTQYPDEETLLRCGVMKDFKEQNEKVLKMWINVKANKAGPILIGSLIGFVVLVGFIALYIKWDYIVRKRRLKKK